MFLSVDSASVLSVETITIQIATPADVEQIADLALVVTRHSAAARPGTSEYVASSVAGWLADPDTHITAVARVGGNVIGVMHIALMSPRESMLDGARVDPDYRRKRVASRLADALLREAGRRWGSMTVVRALVDSDNTASVAWLHRYGFRRAACWRASERPAGIPLEPAQDGDDLSWETISASGASAILAELEASEAFVAAGRLVPSGWRVFKLDAPALQALLQAGNVWRARRGDRTVAIAIVQKPEEAIRAEPVCQIYLVAAMGAEAGAIQIRGLMAQLCDPMNWRYIFCHHPSAALETAAASLGFGQVREHLDLVLGRESCLSSEEMAEVNQQLGYFQQRYLQSEQRAASLLTSAGIGLAFLLSAVTSVSFTSAPRTAVVLAGIIACVAAFAFLRAIHTSLKCLEPQSPQIVPITPDQFATQLQEFEDAQMILTDALPEAKKRMHLLFRHGRTATDLSEVDWQRERWRQLVLLKGASTARQAWTSASLWWLYKGIFLLAAMIVVLVVSALLVNWALPSAQLRSATP